MGQAFCPVGNLNRLPAKKIVCMEGANRPHTAGGSESKGKNACHGEEKSYAECRNEPSGCLNTAFSCS